VDINKIMKEFQAEPRSSNELCPVIFDHRSSIKSPPQFHFLPMHPLTTLLELYREMELGYDHQQPLKVIGSGELRSEDERKEYQLRKAVFSRVNTLLSKRKRDGRSVDLVADLIMIDELIKKRGLTWREIGGRYLNSRKREEVKARLSLSRQRN
jgi:hypothetical protein